jgi:hypothetical protein
VSLPLAVLKECAVNFTTARPLSRTADRGGAFDVPKDKCPPDIAGGSLGWVTVTPASHFSSYSSVPSKSASSLLSHKSHSFSSLATSYPPISIIPRSASSLPSTPLSGSPVSSSPEASPISFAAKTAPLPVAQRNPTFDAQESHGLVTPPVTPPQTSKGNLGFGSTDASAFEFLSSVFPRSVMSALPYAKGVEISLAEGNLTFNGVVLDLPGSAKTLYVAGKSVENLNLRESIVALLDLADEHFGCSAFVIALERQLPVLGELLHSLMYVGGTVVSDPPFPVDPAHILVGIEI